ncbi:MAG: hypothetical protein HYW25_00585 [Candidatus Aenigmarchaeota archaeon]|nr:hypothetical protein [Candidatus Aenigmarchaeota archaeon]
MNSDKWAGSERMIAELMGTAGMTLEGVLPAVSRRTGIAVPDLRGRAQRSGHVVARAVAIYVLRERFEVSYPNIGRMLLRDHSTVMHSYRSVLSYLEEMGFCRPV